jgi:hypothetical protein
MLKLLINALFTAALVLIVGELARKYPRLGAIALFVPFIPYAILAGLYLKIPDPAPSVKLARDFLILGPLCLPMFLPIALAPRFAIPFWPAFIVGAVYCLLAISGYFLFTR